MSPYALIIVSIEEASLSRSITPVTHAQPCWHSQALSGTRWHTIPLWLPGFLVSRRPGSLVCFMTLILYLLIYLFIFILLPLLFKSWFLGCFLGPRFFGVWEPLIYFFWLLHFLIFWLLYSLTLILGSDFSPPSPPSILLAFGFLFLSFFGGWRGSLVSWPLWFLSLLLCVSRLAILFLSLAVFGSLSVWRMTPWRAFSVSMAVASFVCPALTYSCIS